jgi:hypothetical protein
MSKPWRMPTANPGGTKAGILKPNLPGSYPKAVAVIEEKHREQS